MMELSKSQYLKLKNLSKEFHIELLILFGSRAKNDYHNNSDWDFAYKRKAELSYDEITHFKSKLSTIISSQNIDIVDIERTYDPLLLREIFLGGICLYETKKDLFDELQNKAWSAYLDFEPNYKLQDEIIQLRMNKLTNN